MMTIVELRKRIRDRDIPRLLVFVGEEYYVRNAYVGMIASCLSADIVRPDTVAEYLGRPRAKSLFGGRTELFVITDDDSIRGDTKTWERLRNTADNVIFCLAEPLGKDFEKFFDSHTVSFAPLSPKAISTNILKEYDIGTENAMLIAEGCGMSLGRCFLELDKIRHLGLPDRTAFAECLSDGFCLDDDVSIRDMVHSFVRGDTASAFSMLDRLRATEAPLRILAFFRNMYRNLLVCKGTSSPRDIEASTGLGYHVYRELRPYLGRFSLDYLEYALYVISDIEKGIKTGVIEPSVATDVLMCRLL